MLKPSSTREEFIESAMPMIYRINYCDGRVGNGKDPRVPRGFLQMIPQMKIT